MEDLHTHANTGIPEGVAYGSGSLLEMLPFGVRREKTLFCLDNWNSFEAYLRSEIESGESEMDWVLFTLVMRTKWSRMDERGGDVVETPCHRSQTGLESSHHNLDLVTSGVSYPRLA